MKIVITTGCADSGWDIVLPILQKSGFDAMDDCTTLGIDTYFQETGIGEMVELRQPLQPDPLLGERVTALLPKNPLSPVLVADSRNIWLLDFWARQFPQAQFLLFYVSAETALANALQSESEPQQFMEHWQVANGHLLKFHHRHRQRSLLFDAEAAYLNPSALEIACQRIGLTIKPSANTPEHPNSPFAVERLIAINLLTTHPAALNLQMELEASAQPLGGVTPINELRSTELIDSYRQLQTTQRNLQRQLEQSQENLHKQKEIQTNTVQEKDLLLIQLHNAQRGLEQTFLKNQQNEAVINQQTIALQDQKYLFELAQQKSQNLEATHRDLEQENELLLVQLHQVQEELELTFFKNQQNEKALSHQATSQQDQKGQLEKAQQTLQNLESTHRDLEQENELLLVQLHQVQEELEHYFLKWQAISAPQDGPDRNAKQPYKFLQIFSWDSAMPSAANKFFTKIKEQKKIQKQITLLKSSGLFDEAWYLTAYPDVASEGMEPIMHYIRYGAAEGRNPSSSFNTRAYLASNPDVAADGMNPLVHYVKYGKLEGRFTNATGNAVWH